MARSTYIYVVERYVDYSGETYAVTAAFTVKHEMQTWLDRNPGDYRIWRMSDGASRDPILLDTH